MDIASIPQIGTCPSIRIQEMKQLWAWSRQRGHTSPWGTSCPTCLGPEHAARETPRVPTRELGRTVPQASVRRVCMSELQLVPCNDAENFQVQMDNIPGTEQREKGIRGKY